jgi:hypothetical protein
MEIIILKAKIFFGLILKCFTHVPPRCTRVIKQSHRGVRDRSVSSIWGG